jgi:LmbE family N-acetylglucosaminyl deacetylase
MIVAVREPSSGERVVVVSPHLDDGVLSLGASIASWSRAGAAVELLTVLGCDPGSTSLSGGWDRRGGFATEGASALARREEDRQACIVLGATPVWLPFGSVDYERHGDEADVRRAVGDAVADADILLLPGFPLSHPDHDWLARTLVSDFTSDTSRGAGRIGLYAEQPYTRRVGGRPHVPAVLADLVGPAAFEPVRAPVRDRFAKWRAIRCYTSQLPLLAMRGSLRRGPHRYAAAPEWIAWGPDYPSTSA